MDWRPFGSCRDAAPGREAHGGYIGPRPFRAPSVSQKIILIVDDSATMRRMIIAALRALGDVAFDEAGSGLEAIERLAVANVDAVVLDLNMPDIHGFEVLRFIRGHARFKQLPVAVLTTRGDDASRAEALNAGATVYFTKPFVPQSFAPAIERLLTAIPVHG